MVAPDAVNVAELPLQIAVGLLDAVTVGIGTTLMATVFWPEHPRVLPFTV